MAMGAISTGTFNMASCCDNAVLEGNCTVECRWSKWHVVNRGVYLYKGRQSSDVDG